MNLSNKVATVVVLYYSFLSTWVDDRSVLLRKYPPGCMEGLLELRSMHLSEFSTKLSYPVYMSWSDIALIPKLLYLTMSRNNNIISWGRMDLKHTVCSQNIWSTLKLSVISVWLVKFCNFLRSLWGWPWFKLSNRLGNHCS